MDNDVRKFWMDVYLLAMQKDLNPKVAANEAVRCLPVQECKQRKQQRQLQEIMETLRDKNA